ncbi:MAG: transaldolase [Desulfobacterales bacterium]
MNPVKEIRNYGQSIWLDYIQRDLILSGELKRLIEADGLRGVTSNPAIFEKSISGDGRYDAEIKALASRKKNAEEIYDVLSREDIVLAADVFREEYSHSGGKYGYVSLEVDPHLAYDPQGTVEEARRLWHSLNRPNVMIKIPGTKEGLVAVEGLTREGMNINVTLLFGLRRYREVQEAYIAGLEERLKKGESLSGIQSVASFFISRIDNEVDRRLTEIIRDGGEHAEACKSLKGKIAIACAKSVYTMFKEAFNEERFKRLEEKGALPQRVLWASTSTKNPEESDVKYVEALIGPNTINTIPMETLTAYRDHGKPEARLESDLDCWRKYLSDLERVGIDIEEVAAQLEQEGVLKFTQPHDRLIERLTKRLQAVSKR